MGYIHASVSVYFGIISKVYQILARPGQAILVEKLTLRLRSVCGHIMTSFGTLHIVGLQTCIWKCVF